jgi:hypothetical protein
VKEEAQGREPLWRRRCERWRRRKRRQERPRAWWLFIEWVIVNQAHRRRVPVLRQARALDKMRRRPRSCS